jgi:hypothetical protein
VSRQRALAVYGALTFANHAFRPQIHRRAL